MMRASLAARVPARGRSAPSLAALPIMALPAAAALLALGRPAALSGQVQHADPPLEEIRAAVERFRDVAVALEEGYVPDPSGMCVTAEMEGRPAEEGAMGIHYLRPDLLGITSTSPRLDGRGTHTDWLEPAILLYEPRADGHLELIGIENLVFERAWEAAGHDRPPTLHGRTWDRWADDPATPADEAHGIEPHFDQHVWLFREHPTDPLAPFNPAVSCDHAAPGPGPAPGS